jgi:hypothetical protein
MAPSCSFLFLILAISVIVTDGWLHVTKDAFLQSRNRAPPCRSSAGSEETTSNRGDTDWLEAELTLLAAPSEPSPDLSPEQVALACCRSLQWVDYPTQSAGLKRCYDFFTFECRKAVTARQGGQTVERFCEYGLLSPALQPFIGAKRLELGSATLTPAQPPFRGALTSFPVVIHAAAIFSVQHPSGMSRQGIAEPPTTNMVIRLEQQRRPPFQGCWLVREVMDVRHAFAGDMGNVIA